MNVMFMGTEVFALEVLQSLYEAKGSSVNLSVVTQTDKPRGRGHKTVYDCVKNYALEKGLTLYQPQNLREENFRDILEREAPRMIVVASYGKILPSYVLNYPECGCVCVHASLLPKYRGAAPINRVIMDGEERTGVTLMYMDNGIDTGNMIAKAAVSIGNMNSGELRGELSRLGAQLLLEHFDRLSQGICPSEKQDNSLSCYAAKITADDRPIDFSATGKAIVGKIKGLAPAPGAVCRVQSSGLALKVLDAQALPLSVLPDGEFGELVHPSGMKKNSVAVKCADGVVILTLVQPEGSKPMDGASLLSGRKLCYPDRLL